MEFAKAQKYTARVSEKYYLTDNEKFLYIKFELVLPDRIAYQAGQYVSIKVNEQGERRSYSIASTSDDNHGFHILAEMVAGGKGSTYLKNLAVGEVVEVMAPLGRFVVNETNQSVTQSHSDTVTQNKLLFVATGSGIVPIYSMINDLLINKRETRQIRLHWGMRNQDNLFWIDNFDRLMEAYPNFVFDLVLSQPSESWELCSGHVQDCLKRDFPLASSGLKGWEGYVCGSPQMVEEVTKLLGELGVAAEHIYHEKFT